MAGAQEIRPGILAATPQIARRLFLLGGKVNGRQRARAIQDRELPGIAPIRL